MVNTITLVIAFAITICINIMIMYIYTKAITKSIHNENKFLSDSLNVYANKFVDKNKLLAENSDLKNQVYVLKLNLKSYTSAQHNSNWSDL